MPLVRTRARKRLYTPGLICCFLAAKGQVTGMSKVEPLLVTAPSEQLSLTATETKPKCRRRQEEEEGREGGEEKVGPFYLFAWSTSEF